MTSTITAVVDAVKGKAPLTARRSSKWRKVRADFIKANPCCAACGGTVKLEVHHIVPFHVNAALELDPNNLIVLCESGKGGVNCHLHYGHLGNYKAHNEVVIVDTKMWRNKLQRVTV